MSLNTSLKGRLRNTNLPKLHSLFHLFGAAAISIHSIDERIKLDQEFEIIDNGIGFNKNNYKSFQHLDSECKKSLIYECVTCKSRITENMIAEVH